MMNRKEALSALWERFLGEVSVRFPDAVPVFGDGDPDIALSVMIGEAPGAKETELRRPFVGKAGENLNEFLRLAQMERSSLYITNAVKFRPFKVHPVRGTLSNRPPNREELEFCSEYLKAELEILAPRRIITLGNTPLRAVTGDPKLSVGDVHGKCISINVGGAQVDLWPLYHPASIIYNRSLAPVYEEDILRLGKAIREKK